MSQLDENLSHKFLNPHTFSFRLQEDFHESAKKGIKLIFDVFSLNSRTILMKENLRY